MFDCPDKPCCVSSECTDSTHFINPISITGDPDIYWQKLCKLISTMQRITVIEQNDDYLHAEALSRYLRFTDDIEFSMQKETKTIAVRSVSRVGYWDFGVNRRRVECIRKKLMDY